MRRRSTGLLVVSSLALALLSTLPAPPAQATPQNPRKGWGDHGLESAKGKHLAHCPDHMKVATASGICTHGADEARAGVDVTQPRSVQELRNAAYDGNPPATTPATVPGVGVPSTDGSGVFVCEGNGTSGKRVQVLYVRTADVTSRFAALRDTLEQDALYADWQYNASAAQTGGARHLRFVTDSAGNGGCTLDIKEVVLPTPPNGTAFDFGYSTSKLSAAGYNSSSRKYLMFTDATYLCGVGSMWGDDRAGSVNYSDYYSAEYARVDSGCWHYAEGHELMHNLGGVQDSAPHSSLGGHCYDEYDDMCYSDGGSYFTSGGAMQYPCAGSQADYMDCNKDDYFNTAPVAGSYLATKWNTATSSYLIKPAVAASNTVQVATPSNQSGTFGTASTPVQVTATDATPGQVLSYAAAGLPTGLTINSGTGLITGTPMKAGTATVVVTAADGANAAGMATFTWAVAPVAPYAPTSVTVTPGRKQLGVSWTAPIDGGSPLSSYDVTVTPQGGAPVTTSTGSTATSFSATGLVNGTTYDVTVAATNAIGTGAASAPVSGAPSAVVPDVPTGVTATPGDGGASIAFTAPADDGDLPITSFTATASTGEQVSGPASPLTLTGLGNDVARTFTVTATNDKGTGAASAPSAAVTYWSSTLSITRSLSTVVAGSKVVLSGTLASGPAAQRPLTLTTYASGQPVRTTALSTTSSGTWAVSMLPSYNTRYRVSYAGDATHRAATSALVLVMVKTRVAITSPANGLRTTARTLRISGRTTPNKSGVAVYLYEVRRDGSLAYLTTARVTIVGTFSLVRTFAPGWHRLVVTIGTTPTNAAGRSAPVAVDEV